MARQYFNMPKFEPFPLIDENRTVCGVNLGKMFEGEGMLILKEELQEILELYRKGLIKPVISKVFPFEQAGTQEMTVFVIMKNTIPSNTNRTSGQAHQFIQERGNTGKVILVPELPGKHPVQSSHPSAPIPIVSEPIQEPAPEPEQQPPSEPSEPAQETTEATAAKEEPSA